MTCGISVVALVVGHALQAHFQLRDEVCNSGYGSFARSESSSVNVHCGGADLAVTAGQLLHWFGLAGFVIAAFLFVAALVGD